MFIYLSRESCGAFFEDKEVWTDTITFVEGHLRCESPFLDINNELIVRVTNRQRHYFITVHVSELSQTSELGVNVPSGGGTTT